MLACPLSCPADLASKACVNLRSFRQSHLSFQTRGFAPFLRVCSSLVILILIGDPWWSSFGGHFGAGFLFRFIVMCIHLLNPWSSDIRHASRKVWCPFTLPASELGRPPTTHTLLGSIYHVRILVLIARNRWIFDGRLMLSMIQNRFLAKSGHVGGILQIARR